MRKRPIAFVLVATLACHKATPAPPGVTAPTPMIPGMPGMPPGAPMPTRPPGMPMMPGMPGMPGMIPGMPGMPAMPGMPGMPQANAAPVVNWRALMPFVPDTLGGMSASGVAEGSTAGVMGMQVSEVHRTYANGPRHGRVAINDTTMNPGLRMAFTMAQSITVDSTDHQSHGVTVAGNPGLFEWRQGGGPSSKVTVFVSNRFLVEVEVSPAASNDEAVGLASSLNLTGLAAVH